MNTVTLQQDGIIVGMTGVERGEMDRDFREYDIVRRVERWSIREFMRDNAQYLRGRVLDFGAGTQPYRDLVKGEYVPWSPGQSRPSGPFDAVMCNQVLQYVSDPRAELVDISRSLRSGGHLVLTFPTNWDEVEDIDMWRFTATGMKYLLRLSGFEVVRMERRAQVTHGLFKLPLGYGCVAERI